MSDISKRYNELKVNNIAAELTVKISTFIPEPEPVDYQRGYLTRYFVQKVNDKAAPIFEISNREFGSLSTNPLYNTTSLRWRITGPKQPTYNPKNGEMTDMGVHESNKKSIEIASSLIPNLKLYLPNTAQFWKDE